MKIFDDFSGMKIFKEATVDTCIIQIKKGYVDNCKIQVNNEYYLNQNRLSNDIWSFTNPKILNLKDKIINKSILIKDLKIEMKYGLKTGFNKAYVIDYETYNNFISLNKNNKQIIKPILKGTDIDKFKIEFKNRYIIIVKHWHGLELKENYPDIYNYLIQYEEKLKQRGQVKNGQHHWLDLDNNVTQDYLNYFDCNKIIWQRVCKEPNFAIDFDKHCVLDSMAFLTSEDTELLYYLLAILNSKLIKWYLKLIGHKYGKTGFLVSNQYVKKLPIPNTTSIEKQDLIDLSKKIIKYMKEPNKNKIYLNRLYNELNYKIYTIYNLNDSEITLINDSV